MTENINDNFKGTLLENINDNETLNAVKREINQLNDTDNSNDDIKLDKELTKDFAEQISKNGVATILLNVIQDIKKVSFNNGSYPSGLKNLETFLAPLCNNISSTFDSYETDNSKEKASNLADVSDNANQNNEWENTNFDISKSTINLKDMKCDLTSSKTCININKNIINNINPNYLTNNEKNILQRISLSYDNIISVLDKNSSKNNINKLQDFLCKFKYGYTVEEELRDTLQKEYKQGKLGTTTYYYLQSANKRLNNYLKDIYEATIIRQSADGVNAGEGSSDNTAAVDAAAVDAAAVDAAAVDAAAVDAAAVDAAAVDAAAVEGDGNGGKNRLITTIDKNKISCNTEFVDENGNINKEKVSQKLQVLFNETYNKIISNKENIVAIQLALSMLRYDVCFNNGKIDGILGGRTESAVKAFQKKFNKGKQDNQKIKEDGLPGPITVKALIDEIGKESTEPQNQNKPETNNETAEVKKFPLKEGIKTSFLKGEPITTNRFIDIDEKQYTAKFNPEPDQTKFGEDQEIKIIITADKGTQEATITEPFKIRIYNNEPLTFNNINYESVILENQNDYLKGIQGYGPIEAETGKYYARLDKDNPNRIFEISLDNNGDLNPIIYEINPRIEGGNKEKILITPNKSCINFLQQKTKNFGNSSSIQYYNDNKYGPKYCLTSFGKSISIEAATMDEGRIGGDLETNLKYLNLTNFLRSESAGLKGDNPDLQIKNGQLRVKQSKASRENDNDGRKRWNEIKLEKFGLGDAFSNNEPTDILKKFIKYNNGEKREDDYEKKPENKHIKRLTIKQ